MAIGQDKLVHLMPQGPSIANEGATGGFPGMPPQPVAEASEICPGLAALNAGPGTTTKNPSLIHCSRRFRRRSIRRVSI
eukprot:11834472-Alexandrium_andersonii.AAC.1